MCVHFEYRLNSGRAIPEKTCPILGAKLGENRPSHLVDQCSKFWLMRMREIKILYNLQQKPAQNLAKL